MRTTLAGAILAVALVTGPAIAQNVKITPVGSHPGELRANDLATIFEDPTGVRVLYDVGHTVTGGDDSRLGHVGQPRSRLCVTSRSATVDSAPMSRWVAQRARKSARKSVSPFKAKNG